MPPRPPSRSYQQILADSPLRNAAGIQAMFPSPDSQRRLEALGRALDAAAAANSSEAQTWQTLADFKDTVLALLRAAIGRPPLP